VGLSTSSRVSLDPNTLAGLLSAPHPSPQVKRERRGLTGIHIRLGAFVHNCAYKSCFRRSREHEVGSFFSALISSTNSDPYTVCLFCMISDVDG